MTIHELGDIFSHRFFRFGSMKLLNSGDTLTCLRMGLENSMNFLGFDGFYLLATGAIQPSQHLDIDVVNYLSFELFLKDSLDLVNASANDPSIYFQVVMEDIKQQKI